MCVFSCILIKCICNSTTTLNRHEISCHVMYDDPKLGLCANSKQRGRSRLSELLKSDSIKHSEIKALCSELTYDSGKKLLMTSFASDEMIWETMKYLEVFFMDCTARANKLFFSVICTPSSKCQLSDMTVIPPGKLFARFVPTTIILSLTTTTETKQVNLGYIFMDIFRVL